MRTELGVEPLHARFIPTRHGHAAPELIAHDGAGDAPETGEGPRVARDPLGKLLRARRLGVRVARRAERHDKELDGDAFAGGGIGEAGLLARVVNEALLARAVDLTHREPTTAQPLPIDFAVLRVLVAVRMALEVLEVEELQRHGGPPAFGVNVGAVRLRPRPPRTLGAVVEPGLERVIRHRLDRRPGVEPGRPSPMQRAADRADAQPDAARHGPVASAKLPLLPENLADGPHG